MTDLINLIVILIAIYGWYIFLVDLINILIYQKINFGKEIKLQVTVKNQEENIEMIIKKINTSLGPLQDLEIIDDNSTDKTYEILTKIQQQNRNIKIKRLVKDKN